MAVALTCATAATAQQTRDVVYLKNGSIIHGQVAEMSPEGNIKIVNGLGDTLIFPMADVDRTTKETLYTEPFLRRGYRGFAGFQGIWGCLSGAGIVTTHGYQFNGHMFAGIGCGLFLADDIHTESEQHYSDPAYTCTWGSDDYDDGGVYCGEDEVRVVVPIFATFRYEFIQKKITPYVEVSVGGVACDVRGFMLNPMVGARFNRFNLAMGLFSVPNAHVYNVDNEKRNQFTVSLSVDFGRHNW